MASPLIHTRMTRSISTEWKKSRAESFMWKNTFSSICSEWAGLVLGERRLENVPKLTLNLPTLASAPILTLRRAGDNCARPECLNAKLIIERLDIYLSFLEIVRGKLLALVLQNVDSRLDIVSIKQYRSGAFYEYPGKRIYEFSKHSCMCSSNWFKRKADLWFNALSKILY